MKKMLKQLTLAAPRGFCAGVDRAVRIVEIALEKFGKPVYVRHEIVHNKTVVDGLAAKGAIFVKELDEVPKGAPVVFSAHGVSRAVVAAADDHNVELRRAHLVSLGLLLCFTPLTIRVTPANEVRFAAAQCRAPSPCRCDHRPGDA